MDKLQYTSDLYGKNVFSHFNTDGLPDGMADYHKKNFQKYFGLSEAQFKGLKVLDTGSGCGRQATVLALMGANVTGADLSPENVARGKRLKAHYKLDNLEFFQHDFMKPFGGQYDLVSAHNWVQHTENPAQVIQNLLSSLRVGGKIYLSVYLAGTFRFFIAQIAREILHPECQEMVKKLVKFHYPAGFSGFRNPDDICMEIILDDFFVPYCNTTTFDIFVRDFDKLGCRPLTKGPQIPGLPGIDSIYLRMAFEKEKNSSRTDLEFTGPMLDEFDTSFDYVKPSAELAKKVIAHFKRLDDPVLSCSFVLGLFRVRSETNRSNDGPWKHGILQSYLKSVLSDSLKEISMADTARAWKESEEQGLECPTPPGARYY